MKMMHDMDIWSQNLLNPEHFLSCYNFEILTPSHIYPKIQKFLLIVEVRKEFDRGYDHFNWWDPYKQTKIHASAPFKYVTKGSRDLEGCNTREKVLICLVVIPD